MSKKKLFSAMTLACLLLVLKEISVIYDRKQLIRVHNDRERLEEQKRLLNVWLNKKMEGWKAENYFSEKGYTRIAIYGMNELGTSLAKEMKDSEIIVRYCIDKDKTKMVNGLTIVSPNDPFDPVDVIVIAAVSYFDEIVEVINNKIECPVISIENILYES
nr:hypothetical protein [uncultured Butyrivibrio sp.]